MQMARRDLSLFLSVHPKAALIAIRLRAHYDLHPAKLGLHYARVLRHAL